MDEPTTETAADAPPAEEAPAEARRRRRWVLPVSLVPAVLLVVLVVGWAIDTSSGGVARNVTLAGVDISNESEAEVTSAVEDLAARWAEVPVELVVRPGRGEDGTEVEEPDVYRTTAGEIGLMVDEDRTVEAALDVGDSAFLLFRPFEWAGSFLSDRDAPVVFQVSSDQVASATLALEGNDRIPAEEPTVELVEGRFKVVPGTSGSGIDAAALAAALPEAAEARGDDGPVRIELERTELPPLGEDGAAEEAAAGAEALVAEPVSVTTSEGTRTISSDQLRQWVTLSSSPDGSVAVDLDRERTDAGLRALFGDIAGGPVDAHFTIEGGKPVIVPERSGKVCCGDDAAAKVMQSLRDGTRAVTLDLVDAAPTFTAAQAAQLGIIEEVGQPTVFVPTTEHKCCESRVQNIHRIADLIRGVVIKPGETFSVNDHVGRRTRAKGFTDGGAIIDGRVSTTVGGGISQFATTFFNAALFAGLDFGEYQSHSLYISRYPRGREATLSWTHPDLQVRNSTPYGVLVWPTYTDTSITVHLYSTHHVDVTVGEPTASPAGNCTKYTVGRTRTYVDGRVEHDSVFARYRPAEGVNC
jgi:vancomycin resistance protein YoaR